ncbi:MAG: glycosyltransferase [Candidatus Ratteibacteria bacterium]|nr:glycosyltransferase [Candidatus Ratteibacteria bacterium]
MAKEPLISVIIPAYNRAKFLEEAVKSVLAQTYKNWELIIVDDGSTDDTSEVVKKFLDERIIYLHQDNKGASAARNKGILKAKGEYIAFLDSDDMWLPQKLQKQLEVFNKSRFKPGVVYTGIQYMDYKGNLKKQRKLPAYRGNIFKKLLRKNIAGIGSTMLVKKECFEKCGSFDENLPSRMDLDMILRISEHFTVDYVPEILALERIHEGRITADIEKKIKGREMLFDKIRPYLKKHRILLAKYLYETGELYFENGNMEAGREYLVRSFKIFPLLRSAMRLLALKIKR